jgi:hypothetical protein
MRHILFAAWLLFFGAFNAFGDPLNDTDAPTLFTEQSVPGEAATDEIPEENTSVTDMPGAAQQRLLYSSIVKTPERLFKGEVFGITIRSIVTTEAFETLQYNIIGGQGLKLLNSDPRRTYRDHTYYDRFYFKVTGNSAQLPDIVPTLIFSDGQTVDSQPIKGVSVNVTVLNPPKDFCGILADTFEVTHLKATMYDDAHTIVVISADANGTDLSDFHLSKAGEQDFESIENDVDGSTMNYYAVLPKTLETLRFEYFNLHSRSFEHIALPIKVDNDFVSTVSDLKPTDHGHDYQKTVIFAIVAVTFIILALWRRNWFFFVIAVAAAGYAAWLSIPLRKVCIKQGASIYLLPMRNAPVFEKTPVRYELEKQGHITNYTKVRLHNDKIGWVKDDDICPN